MKLSHHSFIKNKPNRWKQKLKGRIVEDQYQPGTQIQLDVQILMRRLETFLKQILMTLLIGRRPENLKLSHHSFIKNKPNRWKQKLMEMIVEDQNQPGTRIQIDLQILMRRLETFLKQILMTLLIGRKPENLNPV
ncbi:hypothetical protein EYF80_066409 [Liparis tanakae]|uniref:Uncharacterized protein n=1 Tax=Liparis tanakae TaxID=230148 RepID=A0A4Z2E4H5_9TELE|nr:hypothetical protein EYF80_066409 [Liparis tanakae]